MLVEIGRKLLKRAPDKVFLQAFYFRNMKRFINFRNPKSFNEKIQWMKVYDRKKLYNTIADKYEVREYVKQLWGDTYLIPCYGVYNSTEEIDIDRLPDEFVLKCTHDSGSVVVCRNKAQLDWQKAREKLEKGLKRNAYDYAREWQYKDIQPRIIAEKLLVQDDDVGAEKQKGIVDYKFFCYNGEAKFYYASRGLEDHATARISFYDLDGKEMPFHRSDYKRFEDAVCPKGLKKMVELAEKAAKTIGSPFIRVDFYEIAGNIYFSEFTLHPCSGVMPIVPKQWDETLGSWLKL